MIAADRALSQDQHTVWQGKADAAEVQQAFRFVEFQRKRAEEARAAAPLSEPMPQMLNQRYLTKHLRNGQALCTTAQGAPRMCGSNLRACGGAHPASECRATRMLKEPPVQRRRANPAGARPAFAE